MVRQRDKKIKVGRNDPCWCGSTRKYKDCHAPVEQAQRGEQLKLRQAQDTLFPRIIEAAQSVPERFATALEQFWEGKYTPEQISELDDLEEERGAERFLTWFAFDYRQDDGSTLVEELVQAAATGGFEVDPFEQCLLTHWASVRLRPYQVEQVRKGSGLLVRDLLDEIVYTVADNAASRRMAAEEIMVAHLVPVGGWAMLTPAQDHDPPYGRDIDQEPTYCLAGAAAQLTGDTCEKLVEFVALHLEDLRRSQPSATWDDLLRQRSFVLNHFIMALPREVSDPTMVENIVMKTRVALALTGQSLSGLIGRGKSADLLDEAEDETDATDALRTEE